MSLILKPPMSRKIEPDGTIILYQWSTTGKYLRGMLIQEPEFNFMVVTMRREAGNFMGADWDDGWPCPRNWFMV